MTLYPSQLSGFQFYVATTLNINEDTEDVKWWPGWSRICNMHQKLSFLNDTNELTYKREIESQM